MGKKFTPKINLNKKNEQLKENTNTHQDKSGLTKDSTTIDDLTSEVIGVRIDNSRLFSVLHIQAYILIPCIIIYVLHITKPILAPAIISFVISYIIMNFRDKILSILNKIWIIRGFSQNTNTTLATLTSIIVSCLFIYLFSITANRNINEISAKTTEYHEKMISIIDKLSTALGLVEKIQWNDISNQFHIGTLFKGLSQLFLYVFSEAFSIALYTAFLLASWGSFHKVIIAICDFKGISKTNYLDIRDRIDSAIKEYLYIKIVVSLMTALISFAIMTFMRLDFALFWSILIFILNFIPTVGSIIATIIPSLLAIIQFGVGFESISIISGLMATQVIIGNIVEPQMMGKSLNLNPFMMILFLSIWGEIWGIIGMLLCVPIMVIMLIVFKEFPSTGAIAILLSADGDIFTRAEKKKGANLRKTMNWLIQKRNWLKSKSRKQIS